MPSLEDYLLPDVKLARNDFYWEAVLDESSEAIRANDYYFSNTQWATEYLTYCHRDEHFRSRWLAAAGDWTGKIVLDVGCGPGNVFANLGGSPALLIGVDIAGGSLQIASKGGYQVLRADAAKMPFRSGFADIVAVNASIHHCEDMDAVLKEAARMVKPGGILITDHDPQLTAWDYKGAAKLLWNLRLVVYRVIGHGFHKSATQQNSGLKTEIHHRPGHGVSPEFFTSALTPFGFDVKVYPHNHETGAEVLAGTPGRAAWKYRLGNRLSGRNPDAPGSALSLMCVARRAL